MVMKYNTQKKKLILPEYGRNIQNMVDFCLQLEDKTERTQCAYSIVDIMGNMFPHLRDVNDFKHILWDHLAVMSDFNLDIEFPFEVIKREDLYSKPDKLDYSRPTMRFRHYGKTLEKLIKLASGYEEGDEKEQLVWLILNHMKKSYMQWNKEVEDSKIFQDLYDLSEGKIDKRNSDVKLVDPKEVLTGKKQRNNNNSNNQKRKK